MSKATNHERRDWPESGLKVTHVLMDLDVGGAERLLSDALPLFDRNRYRMEVVALGFDGPMGDLLRENRIPVTALNGAISRPGFLLKFYNYLSSNKPDILHTHLYWPGVLGRAFGRLIGIEKIICHEHFIAEELSAGRRMIERFTWKWADAVVGVCDAALKSKESSIPGNVNRITIHNGIRIEDVTSAARGDSRRAMGVPDDNIVAGWVGRVDESVKDLTTLLKTAKMLKAECPSLRWVLIGDGKDREALERESHSQGEDDVVRWLGQRPDARRLYAGMDIFALPSRAEGMPMVILEAMAAGLPVVATRAGGISEIIVDGEEGILFEAGDARAMSQAVKRLAEDATLRKEMGEKGRERANSGFSIERFVEDMDRFYQVIWSGLE